jgi:hypothetical protein
MRRVAGLLLLFTLPTLGVILIVVAPVSVVVIARMGGMFG